MCLLEKDFYTGVSVFAVMSKRGSIGAFVLVVVILVAVVALFFAFKAPRESLTMVQPTGSFAVPAAKEYGGAVRGVAAPGTRAFPAGRAFELPEQSCFKCSCLDQGITASKQETAQTVCSENCGGQIVSSTGGVC